MAAAGLLLCAGGYARADGDLVRLGGKGDAGATTLGFRDDGDTTLTRGFHGGFGGFRGGFGGYGGYRGFGYGGYGYRGFGYGGYGGYYGGYYRPYYSYYRPYYYGSYYYPYSYGGYGYGGYGYGGYGYGGYGYGGYYPYYGGYYGGYSYPYYGGYGGYGGYYPYYSSYYPCAVSPGATVNAVPYNGTPNQQSAQPFMPPADSKNGQTYPYDGGPATPLPKADENAPASQPVPRPTLPREGRIAAQPLPSPYKFTAYGQAANQGKVVTVVVGRPAPLPSPYAATATKVDRPATVTATRIAYPAYGEQPPANTVRVQLTQNK
jgi:hypothetical protein